MGAAQFFVLRFELQLMRPQLTRQVLSLFERLR